MKISFGYAGKGKPIRAVRERDGSHLTIKVPQANYSYLLEVEKSPVFKSLTPQEQNQAKKEWQGFIMRHLMMEADGY